MIFCKRSTLYSDASSELKELNGGVLLQKQNAYPHNPNAI
jgi:hypothetical protein